MNKSHGSKASFQKQLEVTMLNTLITTSLRVEYFRPLTSQYWIQVFVPFDNILKGKSFLALSDVALMTQAVYSTNSSSKLI